MKTYKSIKIQSNIKVFQLNPAYLLFSYFLVGFWFEVSLIAFEANRRIMMLFNAAEVKEDFIKYFYHCILSSTLLIYH